QRRDPLLVTTRGADRVLAQAFPVPRNGGTIKFKLGITAPLDITDPSHGRLALPALVDRNFSFAPDLRHSVWIDSKQPLAASASGFGVRRIDARLSRLSGPIGDDALPAPRALATVDRKPATGNLVARIGEDEPVVQTIEAAERPATAALMLVVDGS